MSLGLSRPASGSTDWFSAVDGNWAILDALNLGKVSKAIDHTWEGDNNDNRVIDLGDNYDWIEVYVEEAYAASSYFIALARAFRTSYGTIWAASSDDLRCFSMSSGNNAWQGKMTAADANKIKLEVRIRINSIG